MVWLLNWINLNLTNRLPLDYNSIKDGRHRMYHSLPQLSPSHVRLTPHRGSRATTEVRKCDRALTNFTHSPCCRAKMGMRLLMTSGALVAIQVTPIVTSI